jgi:hypothetical protein
VGLAALPAGLHGSTNLSKTVSKKYKYEQIYIPVSVKNEFLPKVLPYTRS